MKIVEEKCLDTCVRRNFSFPNSVKTAERERKKSAEGEIFAVKPRWSTGELDPLRGNIGISFSHATLSMAAVEHLIQSTHAARAKADAFSASVSSSVTQ